MPIIKHLKALFSSSKPATATPDWFVFATLAPSVWHGGHLIPDDMIELAAAKVPVRDRDTCEVAGVIGEAERIEGTGNLEVTIWDPAAVAKFRRFKEMGLIMTAVAQGDIVEYPGKEHGAVVNGVFLLANLPESDLKGVGK